LEKETIELSFEFLIEELNINKDKISVTCFAGDKDAPKDEETAKIWESLGIPKSRIYFLGKKIIGGLLEKPVLVVQIQKCFMILAKNLVDLNANQVIVAENI